MISVLSTLCLGATCQLCACCTRFSRSSCADVQTQEATLLLRLPGLRCVALHGFFYTKGSLQISRDSFQKAPKLETLSVNRFEEVILTSDAFAGLTALATVELDGCGLSAIPPALSALSASLTRLALPHNDSLHHGDGDIKTLLTLAKLRKLELQGSAPLNRRSMQTLLNLENAFRAEHGHALAMDVL